MNGGRVYSTNNILLWDDKTVFCIMLLFCMQWFFFLTNSDYHYKLKTNIQYIKIILERSENI